jgi:uncharacterized membrane protein YvlD (DUF360 family)
MRAVLRYILVILLLPAALVVLTTLIPVITVEDYRTALALFVVLGILNALVRPLIVRLTLPLSVYTVGLFSLLINAAMLGLASVFVQGFHVNSVFDAVLGAILLTALVSLADRLAAGPNYGPPWRVIRRLKRRNRVELPPGAPPGLVFLEIDGLAAPILQQAIDDGYVPTLARWLRDGSHRLVPWEAGLPAQTSACQAGILHGNNWDIPAFRWYEKERRQMMASGHPPDARTFNVRISNGHGLLHGNGVSIDNNVDGDAATSVITMSRVQDQAGHLTVASKDFYAFFADPNAFVTTVGHTLWEAAVEVWEAWRQRRQNVQPRVHRGGIYPLVRAITTGALVDLSVYTLMDSMFKGTDVAYVTFVAYDEVAHHAGPRTADALRVLRGLDRQFALLEQVANHTPRPYQFVVLSDHGQSHGATFCQRQGQSLAEVVQALCKEDARVAPVAADDEGIGHTSALLTEVARSNTLIGGVGRRTLNGHVGAGFVDLRSRDERQATDTAGADANVVLCYSGNLDLIYFPDVPRRLSLEEIDARFPAVIDGLRGNQWLGFLMVRSEKHGPVVLGRAGLHYLQTGRVEGDDPLAVFGPTAAVHLRRLDSFPHTGDIVVNSFYDPATGEVAAFEELVGSHGGLGGLQNQPFLLFPADYPLSPAPIVGAENVYPVLAGWLAWLHGTAADEPSAASEGAAVR